MANVSQTTEMFLELEKSIYSNTIKFSPNHNYCHHGIKENDVCKIRENIVRKKKY